MWASEEGPYTVYRYQVSLKPRMTYERVTDPETISKILHAHQPYCQPND